MDSVRQQAASYFDLIVRIRRWNAGFAGIYVEKKMRKKLDRRFAGTEVINLETFSPICDKMK